MNEQEQKMFIQWLAQKTGAKTQEEVVAAIQNLQESGGMEQAINQFKQEINSAQVTKLGTKLDYINRLNNKCPEGYETEKFLLGGKPCSRCKKVKVKSNKKGSVIDEIKDEISKKSCGGKTKKMQDGGVVIDDSLIRHRKKLEEEKEKSIEWKRKKDAALKGMEKPLIERVFANLFANLFKSNSKNTNSTQIPTQIVIDTTPIQTPVNDNSGNEGNYLPEVVITATKPNPKPKSKPNTNISIVDYLISKGIDHSKANRNKIWLSTGGKETYTGTDAQNLELLKILKN